MSWYFIVIILLLFIIICSRRSKEYFHVNDTYKFEDFTYWFRIPPLLYPGGPEPPSPLPINRKLF